MRVDRNVHARQNIYMIAQLQMVPRSPFAGHRNMEAMKSNKNKYVLGDIVERMGLHQSWVLRRLRIPATAERSIFTPVCLKLFLAPVGTNRPRAPQGGQTQ